MNSSAKHPANQKRQQGRLKVAVDAQYRFHDKKEEWLPCNLIDISVTGMALNGKKSFYVGDKIEIRFHLEKRAILIDLEITHLIGRKAGGKVTRMDDADRIAIQEVLNRELLTDKVRFNG